MQVQCTSCQYKFDKLFSQAQRSSNHFCSRSCAAKHNNHLHPKRQPEGACKRCGKTISTRQTYCSINCKQLNTPKPQPAAVRLAKNKQAVVSYRQRMKLKAVSYKGGKCEVCGYNKCVRALSFHHLNPTEKDFTISRVTRRWESVKSELDKCRLLCMNCHAEVHTQMESSR